MKYIVKLNRFEVDLKALEYKIKSCTLGFKSMTFDYENNRFFLEADRVYQDKLTGLQEVKEVILIGVGYKRLGGFSDFNLDVLGCFRRLSFRPKTFMVRVKFISKLPISSKSIIKKINTLLKKEGLTYSKDSDFIVYVEFDKDDKGKNYLISMYKQESKSRREYRQDRLIVLCYPGSVIEISDFLRLSYIFKIPLVIVAKHSSKFDFSLNKAKKMTKGIYYQDFPLKISESLPEGFLLLGFSKLASKDEEYLAPVLKKQQKIAFVFGDEKFGLSDYIRDRMDMMIGLCSERSKPMRASQALSYVLGFEKGMG